MIDTPDRKIAAPSTTYTDESRVDDPALDAYPATDGFEKWEREALRRLDADTKARREPLSIDDVRRVFAAVNPDCGDLERELLAGLAVACWGAQHTEASMERRRRREEDAPLFASLRDALISAVYSDSAIGRSRGAELRVALPAARGDRARDGYDHMHAAPTQVRRNGVAGIYSVDRSIDARKAIRASMISPVDLFFVVASTIGIPTTSKSGRLGPPAKVAVGDLAEQQRQRLCREAGRQPGAPPCPARKAPAKASKGALPVGHAADCPAHGLTASGLGKRIGRARGRLIAVLAERGLIPPPLDKGSRRPLTPAEKRARRPRIEPVRPSFAATGGRW